METYIVVGILILFDILTGITKAIYKEGLNSTILRKGLFHKLSEVFAVFGAWLFEYGLSYVHINLDIPLVEAVTVYISIMECISILENISSLNPKLEKFFKPVLEKLKEKEKPREEKRN